jgi:hypothetical protein
MHQATLLFIVLQIFSLAVAERVTVNGSFWKKYVLIAPGGSFRFGTDDKAAITSGELPAKTVLE